MKNFLPRMGRIGLICLLLLSGLTAFAQPVNDLCADAIVLTMPGCYNGTTIDATAQNPNGAATCGTGADAEGEGVWYTFVGDGNTWTFMFPEGPDWDPEVNVYSGSCASLTCVTGDDDSGPGLDALVMVVNTDPNLTYLMYVHDAFVGTTSDFAFSLEIDGIVDMTPPVVACPEFTANFNACADAIFPNSPTGTFFPIGDLSDFSVAAGGIYVASFDLSACVDDNCSEDFEAAFVDSYEENRVPGCSVDIINVVVIRDEVGNQAADSIFFRSTIAFDGEAPVFTVCPADSLIDCGVVPVVDADDATATSGCGTPVITVSDAVVVGAPDMAGTTYTFTYTATDGCGQITTCEQVFTVQDTTAPIIICEAIEVALDSTGNVTIANGDAVVSIEDNCGGNLSGPFTVGGPTARMFDCLDADSTYQRTVVVTDASGNQGSCTYDVSIIDTIAPVIVCEAIEVALDSTGNATIENADAVVSIYDNCPDDLSGPFTVGGPTFRTFDCSFADSTFQRTVVITDASGNRGECTYDVTVVDNIAPVIVSCVTDTTIYLDENGFASIAPGELLVTEDACPPLVLVGDPLVAFDCASAGESFVFNESDVDASGNVSEVCTITITVLDTVSPVAICQNVTIELDEEGNASIAAGATGTPTAVTEVSGSLDVGDLQFARPNANGLTCGTTSPADHYYEVFNFTISAEDMYTFTMMDVLGPDFYFILYEGGFDPALPCANFLAGDDDGPGSTEPELMIQLTLVPGNYTLVTSTFSGNVPDGPYTYTISSANGGQVFAAGDGGGGSSDAPLVDGGSSDACGIATYAVSQADFTCANVGPNVVTLTVTDVNGNSASCEATVTVEDNIAPEIVVTPQTVVLSNATGTATLTVADLATATDICGIASLTASQLLFTCEDIGEVEVIITATDVNGNVTTAPVIVTVEFLQPNLSCIGEINLTLNDDCQGLLIPRMVLTGNVACLDVFGFDITVMDSDPSNGPIIDGCGSFQYMIRSTSQSGATTNGFTGAFAPANWTVNATGAEASATFTPTTLEITSGVVNDGDFSNSDDITVSYQFASAGTVNFDVDYELETEIIEDILIIDFDGNIIFQSIGNEGTTGPIESGNFNVNEDVPAGSTLMIMLEGDDFSTSGNISRVTISNFSFGGGELLGLDFETCWGIVNAEDKTPPAVVTEVEDVNLLCVDLDANTLTTLPANISKCYEVFSNNRSATASGQVGAVAGTTVAGTMAPQLRARLLAGGLTPLLPTFTDGCTDRIRVCVNDVVAYDAEDPLCEDVILTRTFTATEIAVCP
ncbi:hypothetical protein H9S92_06985, partial [Lewinella lacunae]